MHIDIISPLRYPGSKHRLVDYFEGFLEDNMLVGCSLHEPFAGGASVSLSLLERGVIDFAWLNERDPLMFAFWWAVKNRAQKLCNRVAEADVSLDTWRRLQPLKKASIRSASWLDLAFAGLFFNRCNFSGMLDAGPIGGMSQASDYSIDCRFNKERLILAIERVAKLSSRFEVRYGDGIAYLKKNARRIAIGDGVAYIDPPYVMQGKRLYRFSYDLKTHRDLANLLKGYRFPWIASYDFEPAISDLFHWATTCTVELDYAVKRARRAEELLISNRQLPPPLYVDSLGDERREQEELRDAQSA